MKQLNLKDVTQYVEENIGTFHQKRIAGLLSAGTAIERDPPSPDELTRELSAKLPGGRPKARGQPPACRARVQEVDRLVSDRAGS